MFTVGLTGGIGCGKSTAANMFSALGASIIDTDAISHALTRAGAPGYQSILSHFGQAYLLPDGNLDRAKLRSFVFSDAVAKTQLESLLHPLILQQAQTELEQATGPYAVLVVPLLFETGNYLPLINRSLVIDCAPEVQIQRTMARSPLHRPEIEAIMSQQMPRALRLAQADDVLHNDKDTAQMLTEVRKLHDRYLALSRENTPKP